MKIQVWSPGPEGRAVSSALPATRRTSLLLAGVGLLGSHAVRAADAPFPNRPVRVVVPYPAGGAVDGLARPLAQRMSQAWGQPVVVENRSGANETIGATSVANSPPDGHTLLMATDATMSVNASLFRHLPYDVERGLAPISRLVLTQLVLTVPPTSPARTVTEFISLAKARPGQLNYGSASVGNVSHIAMAWFANRYGLEMNHVPYRGAAPMLQDVLAGRIDAAFGTPQAVAALVQSGHIRALAVSGTRRIPSLPDVPTFVQSGVENPDATFPIGVLAPGQTPLVLRDRIATDIRQVVTDAGFRSEFIDPIGYELVADTPTEFATFIAQDRVKQAERVRVAGASLD